ncbi:MAG: T9SS type A sorting domain-containing protein [Bacteroidota bacterium]
MRKITIITVILLALFTANVYAQIPNSGFEIWTGNEPSGWDNLNSLTSTVFIYTCTKGSPGNPGSYYLNLTTKSVPLVGIVPGIALSGLLNKTTFQPKSGFAYNQRPTALTGNWQYMAAAATDQGFIAVAFTKWNTITNSRDTIGTTYYALPGMVMSWASFNIPITYTKPSNPDTCLIILSASGISTGVANSYLYVDNLGFSFTASVNPNNKPENSMKIYPNPVTENMLIEIPDISNAYSFSYKIINSYGQIVQSSKNFTKDNIGTSALSSGFYQIIIESKEKQYVSKFIKQ